VLRVWWIITEDGPVAPGSVLAVYRISPIAERPHVHGVRVVPDNQYSGGRGPDPEQYNNVSLRPTPILFLSRAASIATGVRPFEHLRTRRARDTKGYPTRGRVVGVPSAIRDNLGIEVQCQVITVFGRLAVTNGGRD